MEFPFEKDNWDFDGMPQNPADVDVGYEPEEPFMPVEEPDVDVYPPPVRPKSRFDLSSVNWNKVLPVFWVVAVIVLVIVFRNDISAFFDMVLGWAIEMLLAFLIIYWLIRRIFR